MIESKVLVKMIDQRTQYNKMPKLSDLDEESDTNSLIVYLKAL